eukprot:GILJ01003296.1.p1 GENE.GILJ01003296.1~~GILJ01003296.1.p1  ORF type:complete len:559 (+),score=84.08 GILJ01003296.1:41-1717(+)
MSSTLSHRLLNDEVRSEAPMAPTLINVQRKVSISQDEGHKRSNSFTFRERLSFNFAVNPFAYKHGVSCYEWFKIIVFGPILVPIRLFLIIFSIICASLVAKLSILGLSTTDLQTKPLSAWRRSMQWPIRLIARLVLFFSGFYWIKVTGKPAPRSVAPILVGAPHSTMFDSFWIIYACMPCLVAKKDLVDIPFVRWFIYAVQTVLIDRADKGSRGGAIINLKQRPLQPGYPSLLIYPEGTCTNRKCLISFKQGAFITGSPVQPILYKFPWKHFDPSWTHGGPELPRILLHSLCQFVNHMEIEFCPVYFPSAEEKSNTQLYADNVRKYMANRLDLPITEHSYEDVFLSQDAVSRKLSVTALNAQFYDLRHKCDISLDDARRMLARFIDVDTNRDGLISYGEFTSVLGLPDVPDVQKLFDTLDRDQSGLLDFREFVVGLSTISTKLTKEDSLQLAFQLFDRSGTGKVSMDDFRLIMNRVFPSLSESELESIFNSADKNKDAHINFDEFVAMSKSRPEFLYLVVEFCSDSTHTLAMDDVIVAGTKGRSSSASSTKLPQILEQ